jgi:hypothetical protein
VLGTLFLSAFSKRDQNLVSGQFIPYKVLTQKNEFFSCSVPLFIFAYPTSEKIIWTKTRFNIKCNTNANAD